MLDENCKHDDDGEEMPELENQGKLGFSFFPNHNTPISSGLII